MLAGDMWNVSPAKFLLAEALPGRVPDAQCERRHKRHHTAKMSADPLFASAAPSHPPADASSSMRQDIVAAYVAAGSRITAWAIVSAVVYRLAGAEHFAALALIRGTIGLLNYTAVGLSPALVRLFATAGPNSQNERNVFSTGIIVASISAIAGLLIAIAYACFFDRLHVVPPALLRQAPAAVVLIGAGTLLRLFSDTAGAVLQTRGRIALDNLLLAASDALWTIATLALFKWAGLLTASCTYAVAGAILVAFRMTAVARLNGTPWPPRMMDWQITVARHLLGFGSLVLLAQLAEYFYAPTDYILINHFFSSADVAAYAPGVQIDLALLMLVGALASVLLPKSAIAHAAGAPDVVRRYYLRGTFASTALVLAAAIAVWFLYPLIFRIWFGPHPPNTKAILDLVLIGTVVGGSSAVGRSVLMGMGKIKAFTIAAVIAGIVNAAASFCFVRYSHFGLRGILYGTLIAVVGRCGIWMPLYVLTTLRNESGPEGQTIRAGELR